MQKSYRLFYLFLTLLLGSTLASCESLFEEEGDCTPKYRITFEYTKNLKWADAFANEVSSVNLYIFDSEGIFVKQYDAAGPELAQPGFAIEFDGNEIKPGDYTMVAWCGLVNDGESMQSFTVPQPVAGQTKLEELICTLNTIEASQLKSRAEGDAEPEYSEADLNFLFHGMIEATLEDNHDGRTQELKISLTKDTNHITVILQQLDEGEDMIANNYDFSIVSADGRLAYNNDLLPYNPVVTYLPWSRVPLQMESLDNGGPEINQGVMADITTSRIMASEQSSYLLTIKDNQDNDKVLATIPVISYALLGKSYIESHYNHNQPMTNQEFLDRMDEYTLTLFLRGDRWVGLQVQILEWREVTFFEDIVTH